MSGFQSHSLLAWWAVGIGLFVFLANSAALIWPSAFVNWARAFPRRRFEAIALTAVDLAWVAWIVGRAPLGRFEWTKPYLLGAAPLAWVLIVVFMDELLAPRALGGLLLLLANPVLKAARWHPSPWRLIMVAIAYAWATVGMILVLSPWHLRRMVEFATRTPLRFRWLCLTRAAVGLALIGLGWFVY